MWLDLIWIWFGFGLILVGFGLDLACFWLDSARSALDFGPSELSQLSWLSREVLGSSLGKAARVTRATRVIKCIIEHKIDHLAP